MYTDILGTSSQLMVNKKLMRLLGIDAAVYLAELLDIVRCVDRKRKFKVVDGKPFFRVDRKYVTEQTSLSEESQALCEIMLEKTGHFAIDPEDRDLISLNVQGITNLIVSDCEAEFDRLQKELEKTKRAKQRTKKEYALAALKRCLPELESDADVIAAEADWVDAVWAKRRLTKAVVQQFQRELNGYAQDKSKKIALVSLAMSSGYATFEWVKNSYERSSGRKPASRIGAAQAVSEGLMTEAKF